MSVLLLPIDTRILDPLSSEISIQRERFNAVYSFMRKVLQKENNVIV